jgi:DNA-damage-inducible protein J
MAGQTINLSIRMNKELKEQAESLFSELGMNMTTAFTVFANAVVRSGKIPFEIALDPFFQAEHQAHLEKVITEYESGEATLVTKTIEELKAMENG